jgi:Ser/Thr protein kinase RdoA (MazF antagonist)
VDELDGDGLDAGLRLAEFAAAHKLTCGAPVRARSGALTVAAAGGVLALLRYVPGSPPDLSAPDQVRRAGQLLAGPTRSSVTTRPLTSRVTGGHGNG